MKILLPLVACLVAGSAFAAFTIPWNKLAGGGKSSATTAGGSVLTVEGTIGQFDAMAGGSSGGGFSLNAGYWAQAIPSPTPGAPSLTIVPQPGSSASLRWQSDAAGWRLQISNNLVAWGDVGGVITTAGTLTVTPTPGVPKQFYRLRFP